MDLKELGNKLATLAPALGAVIGGPAAAAGGAVALLAKAFGLGEDSTPAQVVQAIDSDPGALLKLKALDVEVRRMYLADTQDARHADVEKTKATGKRDWAMYSLGALIVLGFFLLLGLLCFKPLPEGSAQVVFLLFGTLSTSFGAVVQYFYGSSKSSSDKTDIIAGKSK